MGKDPNSSNAYDYKQARHLLKTIRPYIRQFSSSGYIDELAAGDLCMVYGYSGDVMIAANRAREAGKSYKIDYYIPQGGAPTGVVNCAGVSTLAPLVEHAVAEIQRVVAVCLSGALRSDERRVGEDCGRKRRSG